MYVCVYIYIYIYIDIKAALFLAREPRTPHDATPPIAGVGTIGVVEEVPRFPLTNFHGKGGQHVATRAHLK